MTSTSITAVNVFDEIVALSGMGDLGKNIVVESYLTTFSFLDFGKGSAITYLVMLLARHSWHILSEESEPGGDVRMKRKKGYWLNLPPNKKT